MLWANSKGHQEPIAITNAISISSQSFFSAEAHAGCFTCAVVVILKARAGLWSAALWDVRKAALEDDGMEVRANMAGQMIQQLSKQATPI